MNHEAESITDLGDTERKLKSIRQTRKFSFYQHIGKLIKNAPKPNEKYALKLDLKKLVSCK